MRIRRRGISDVITSLVLIMTTVSLATVFFFWALGYMGQSQTATATGINQNNSRVQEQFAINQARFWCSGATGSPCASTVTPSTLVNTGDMVTIYVINYGDIPVTIDHIYYDGTLFVGYSTSTSSCPSQYCFSTPSWGTTPNCVAPVPYTTPALAATAPPITISSRSTGCINIWLSSASLSNWNVGETHTILAASTRGNTFSQAFTVPTQECG